MSSQDPPILPPSSQPKRFFDVVPPSQITPSTTSRPTVVDHGTPQADPMMTTNPTPTASTALESADAEETPDNAEDSPGLEEAQRIKVSVGLPETSVQHVPDQIDDTEAESSADEIKSAEPATVDSETELPAFADTEPNRIPSSNSSDSEFQQLEPNNSNTTDISNADSLSSDNQPPASPLAELPAQADGGMVVVHHRGGQSRIINLTLIVVAIILVVVVVDLLFDAGVIKTSLWHTHFLGTN